MKNWKDRFGKNIKVGDIIRNDYNIIEDQKVVLVDGELGFKSTVHSERPSAQFNMQHKISEFWHII